MQRQNDGKMVKNFLKEAEKAIIKSSAVILILSVAKLAVGFFFNSLVLVTDAIHSFTDLIANFASIIGLKIAQKKPDEKFNYGYLKAENLSALFVSLFIIFLAYKFLMQGIGALSLASTPTNPLITIITASLSIIVSYLLSKYLLKKGELCNSQSLIANGKEKGVDVITSIVVLFAVITSSLSMPYIEGIITIIISLFIFWEGLLSSKESIFSLMDISPSKDYEQKIIKIISKIPGIEGFGNLKLRKAGPTIFGEINIIIRKEVSVKQSSELCKKIGSKAKEEIPELSDLAIKVYPYEPDEKRIALPINEKSEVNSDFGRAKKFMIALIDKKGIINKEYFDNPFIDESSQAGLKSAKFLIDKGVDAIIVKSIGEISSNAFNANLVTIHKTKKLKAESAIEEFIFN